MRSAGMRSVVVGVLSIASRVVVGAMRVGVGAGIGVNVNVGVGAKYRSGLSRVVGGEVRELSEEVRWRSSAVVRFWKGSG